jgi:hypothetical protein
MVGGVIISTYKYDYTEKEDTSWIYSSLIQPIVNEIIFGLGCV